MNSDKLSSYYRWCIVPFCCNTAIKTPEKTFIQVPKDEKRRMIWLNAVRRDHKMISKTSNIFVCEDHFELKNDMENYMQWKLTGCIKRMKKSAVPHKFDCQKDRKRAATSIPRSAAVKRQRMQIVAEGTDIPSTSSDTTENIAQIVNDMNAEEFLPESPVHKKTCEVGITVRPHYRSKETQISVPVKCKSSSPMKWNTSDMAMTPVKFPLESTKVKRIQKRLVLSSSELSDSTTLPEYYNPPSASQSSCTSDASTLEVIEKEQYQKLALKHTIRIVNMKPRLYLGIPKECMFVIKLIQDYTCLDSTAIYLTLQKIRLAQTFSELGDAYGFSESSASRTFSKSVTLISQLMREMIMQPPEEKVQKLLPLPFRARYSKVRYIIDCLEIEIQKPKDSVKQALTWSEYKKANTLKYLIASTPDGIINFISPGFGGQTSDTLIVEKSGFLDTLQPGSVLMADRGFKHIENLLNSKMCKLLRPPSVSGKEKLSKEEVMQTKRIASLRIHIERVIRRKREFKMLKPHSCVNAKLIPYKDHVVVTACGLINMQGPIIK